MEEELGMLLRDHRRQEVTDRERELNLYRSGSAPPTVDGSLTAVGGLFGAEEEIRSDPAYLEYYYSNVNLNPRLPPPVLSKEDWRFTQRLQNGLGGIGDKRRVNRGEDQSSRSLFSMQPGFSLTEEVGVEANNSGEWRDIGGDGLIGLKGIEIGRQKSYADMFQDDMSHSNPVSARSSRPVSRNTFGNEIEIFGSSDNKFALHHEIGNPDGPRPGSNAQNVTGVQNNSVSASQTFASVLGKSLSRSNSPDPHLVARAPSPCLPPVGVRLGNSDKKNNSLCSVGGVSSDIVDSNDLAAGLSGMSLLAPSPSNDIITQSMLQQEIDNHQKFLFDSQDAQDCNEQYHSLNKSDLPKYLYPDLTRKTRSLVDPSNNSVRPYGHGQNSYLRSPYSPPITRAVGSPDHYRMDDPNVSFNGYGSSGYSVNPALLSMTPNQMVGANNLPLFENGAAIGEATAIESLGMDSRTLGRFPSGSNLSEVEELQNFNRTRNHTASAGHQMPLVDPLYIEYLRTTEYAAQLASNFGNPSLERGYPGNSYADLLGIQKAYLGALLQPQKQYGMPFVNQSGDLNNGYYGNPAFGLGMSYPGSPLASPVYPGSPVAPGSPVRHGERGIRFQSGLSNFAGGVMGSWHSDHSGHLGDSFPPSLLDEFKSNKTKCYELSDIAGHVVEFSADQYGSRFIQQKLETATTEEKDMVFEEIMPQAFSLMTDVFGNYVIQKFFEHGSAFQRRELAEQLIGHVLTLSLQMYGCRVIQKAIEFVDLDQQTRMVAELDGHVMRCVRDQNGNHVIQKCIECVPQNAIQFIISSFYDQVVILSTHPYGCRVIQRVLEHCDDPKVQQIMMREIMESICMLAQDQYGNYVVQHLLEHGKPHERSAIIKKLAGQIVQMSQQKFASNVVEKCLLFCGPEERQFLVNEMLGSTEENEPLQAMMKDQFANYVVQKVLETCDEQQREHILSRIKVHLNALKKYTYGKHIVARVEKLVAAGERRMGVQSYTSLRA